MALTEDQIRTAFRMLDIPYSAPFVLVDQISLNATSFTSNTGTSAQTRLRTWLETGMDEDSRTRAGTIIDSYNDNLSLRGVNLSGASVGNITGVNVSGDSIIAPIIEDLRNLVPFYRDLAEMIRGGGAVGSCVVLM